MRRALVGEQVLEEKFGLEEEWRNIVKEAHSGMESRSIRCTSPRHAKYVSRLLLDGAEREVNIYQGIPEEIFYEDEGIAEAFEEASERGVEIGILLQNSADEEFERFCDERGILFRDEVQPESEISHWMFVDDVSYRLEEPHDPEDFKNEKYPKAVVNFNDEDGCNRLRRGHLKLNYC